MNGLERATDAWTVDMSSNPRAVIGPEREGAFQRLTAMIDFVALVARAAWALIRWGK